MANLVQRSLDVRVRIVDRARKQAGLQLAQRLQIVIARSNSTIQRLGNAGSLQRTLQDERVRVFAVGPRHSEPAKKARTVIRATATKLEQPDLEDEAVIRILDGTAFQDALKASEDFVDQLARLLTKALDEERAALLPDGIEEPLPQIPGAARTLTRMTNHKQRLTSVPSAGSLSDQDLEMILKGRSERATAAAEWPTLYSELIEQMEQQHPEVQAFLRAVASQNGAQLELLTDKVRSHLKENEILDCYRINSY